jgi:hypothetical protein
MGRDIIINPNRGLTGSTDQPYITFSGLTTGSINLTVEDDGSLTFAGDTGSLFGISDTNDGLLHSVNDVSGLPIFQVYSDDKIIMGKWDDPAMTLTSGGTVNINLGNVGGSSIFNLGVDGSGNIVTGTTTGDGIYTGSGTVPSSVVATLTDNLTFGNSLTLTDDTVNVTGTNQPLNLSMPTVSATASVSMAHFRGNPTIPSANGIYFALNQGAPYMAFTDAIGGTDIQLRGGGTGQNFILWPFTVGANTPASASHFTSKGTTDNSSGYSARFGGLDEAYDTLTVRNDKRVGIGTAVPNSKLHVVGDGTGTGKVFELEDNLNADLFTVLDNGQVWANGQGGVFSNTSFGNAVFAATTTGAFNSVFGYQAGNKISTASGNTLFGYRAGNDISTGGNATLIGSQAGQNMTTSQFSIAIGDAMTSGIVTGNYNIGIGSNALIDLTSGQFNISVGFQSGDIITTQSNNTFIGNKTGALNTGSGSIMLGHNAGDKETLSNKLFIDNQGRGTEALGRTNSMIYGEFSATVSSQQLRFNANVGVGVDATARLHVQGTGVGTGKALLVEDNVGADLLTVLDNGQVWANGQGGVATNTAFGQSTFSSTTTGANNTAFGFEALGSVTTGTANIGIGQGAGKLSNGHDGVYVGINAGYYATGTGNTFINRAGNGSSNTGLNNIGIGTLVLDAANMSGDNNIALGQNTGSAITTANRNVLLGRNAGSVLTTGGNNVFIGDETGILAEGTLNVAIGQDANFRGGGDRNVALGFSALGQTSALSTGDDNIAIGYNSLFNSLSSDNIAVGESSMAATTTGTNSVALGRFSLATQTTVSNSIGLGSFAGRYETAGNKLFIDVLERSTEALGRTNSLIYGEFNATVANQRLTVNAPLRHHNFTAVEIATMTPLDGDMVYSTTTDGTITSIGFWGYENGAWVKL